MHLELRDDWPFLDPAITCATLLLLLLLAYLTKHVGGSGAYLAFFHAATLNGFSYISSHRDYNVQAEGLHGGLLMYVFKGSILSRDSYRMREVF